MRVLTGRGGGGGGGRRGGAGGNYGGSGSGSWEPNPEVWDIESSTSSSSPSDEEMREDVKYLWPGRVESISAARVPLFSGRGARHHSTSTTSKRGSSPDDRAVNFSPPCPNQPGQAARSIDLDQTDRGVEQNRREVNRLAERKSKLISLLDLKSSSQTSSHIEKLVM